MQDLLNEVQSAMFQACAGAVNPGNPACLAAQYHLATRGNRLRARLCLDACARLGVPAPAAVSLASTCELLHNASLIHDDLMDRSALRRGQQATWKQFDDGIAICTGDLLLAAAYASICSITPATSIPAIAALVHLRTQELILGQAEELHAANATQTVEQYERLAMGKSASLISLSLQLPLTLAGKSRAVPLAQRVAECFAVAYQIADDLCDETEDRLTNSLNVVQVFASSLDISHETARQKAARRGEELLAEFVALAAQLPEQCGAVLAAQAVVLAVQLREASSVRSTVGR